MSERTGIDAVEVVRAILFQLGNRHVSRGEISESFVALFASGGIEGPPGKLVLEWTEDGFEVVGRLVKTSRGHARGCDLFSPFDQCNCSAKFVDIHRIVESPDAG